MRLAVHWVLLRTYFREYIHADIKAGRYTDTYKRTHIHITSRRVVSDPLGSATPVEVAG